MVFADGVFGKPEAYTKREAFLDLVQMAAYDEREKSINGVKYKEHRGDLVVSKSLLCKKWGWKVDKVRRYLDYLQRNGWCYYSCDHQSYQPITLLSIVNYDSYQGITTTPATTDDSSGATTPATSSDTHINKNNNNNKKKGKKVSNDTEESPLVFPFTSELFMQRWGILIQQPKWKKKSRHALQLSLDDLKPFEESFAIKLIEDSIKNDWQGLVFPNTNERYERWKQEQANQQYSPQPSPGLLFQAEAPQPQPEPQPKRILRYSDLRNLYKKPYMTEEEWQRELPTIIKAQESGGYTVINDETQHNDSARGHTPPAQ